MRSLRGAWDSAREAWRAPWDPVDPEAPYLPARPTSSRSPTVVQLPTITRPDHTPQTYRSAISSADSGNLAAAADLAEAMTCDPVFSGVLGSRTFGLLGREMQFATGGRVYSPLNPRRADMLRRRAITAGNHRAALALRNRRLMWRSDGAEVWSAPDPLALAPPDPIADLHDDWRTLYPEAELAKLTAWGINLGVGLAERVPMRNRQLGERNVPSLRCWHPRWLRYEYFTDRWFVMTMNGEEEVIPGDGRWIMYRPYGDYRPWAHGKWRECALPFVLKLNAIYDRARHSEVCGSPARVGTAPSGASEPDRRKWLRDIRDMTRDNAMVYPDGYKLELLEAKGETWGIYDATIAWADTSYRISIVANETTTSTGMGFSNGNVQEATKIDLDRFTNESLASTLQQQGTSHWMVDNHASNDAPRGEWEIDPVEDRKKEAEILIALGDGGKRLDEYLKGSGLATDAAVIMGRFDIPTRELPAGTAPAAKIDLGVDAVMAVVRGAPALDSLGLPHFGDARDNKTIAELLGKVQAPAAPMPADPLATGSADTVGPDPGAAPLTDEQAAALAKRMTDLGADRCWHGTVNACRFCRVEQRRDPVAGANGEVTWVIAWHPIAPPAPAAAAPLAEVA